MAGRQVEITQLLQLLQLLGESGRRVAQLNTADAEGQFPQQCIALKIERSQSSQLAKAGRQLAQSAEVEVEHLQQTLQTIEEVQKSGQENKKMKYTSSLLSLEMPTGS